MPARSVWTPLAILVISVAPATALADKVRIGHGSDPGVAVDSTGTAHVAYNGEFASEVGEPLMYCSWPRGARGCAPRPIVTDGEAPSSQPALVRAGPASGEVAIVSARDELQVVRSADGGATFGPPAAIGTGRYFDGAFGPGDQLALSIRNLGFVEYYHRSLAGPPDANGQVNLNQGHAIASEVGFADGRPVLVSGARVPRLAVSSWTGLGDVHDPATWAGPFEIARSNYFALASGPSGLFLAHEVSAGGVEDRMVVRRFEGERFGRARRVPAGRLGRPGVIGVALAQDPKGRLVAAWYSSPRNRIEVSASRTGRRWTPARVLAGRTNLPGDIEIGLGPDGRGLVVWDANTGNSVRAIRVSARALLRGR
ncbi:MAG: hypothetical protein GEU88_05040 [Solirubrobacterales bacterium]|nr:hypothetical protein [Solirubrobacterales bacterium]